MIRKTLFVTFSLIAITHGLKLSNFTLNFYKLIAQSTNANFVISPASLALSTGLVLHGASGETKQQIADALGDSNQLGVLSQQIENDKSIESANRIYIAPKFTLKESYQQLVESNLRAKAESVDFGAKVETAAKINKFISDTTHGLIKDLIKPESLDADIAAMLINAIYYKGAWQHQFNILNYNGDLTKSDFYLSKDEKVERVFMSVDEKFKFAKITNEGVKLVELPYKNTSMSLVIILPMKVDGLKEFEENLTSEKLIGMLGEMGKGRDVFVHMPRFKITFEKKLNDVMKDLGMRKLFTSNAELDNLVNGKELMVDEVLQKVVIDVNEKGTEAAAATSLKAYPMCSTCGPESFYVNHPFMFLLKSNDFVYFMGKVVDPQYE